MASIPTLEELYARAVTFTEGLEARLEVLEETLDRVQELAHEWEQHDDLTVSVLGDRLIAVLDREED
jgi:hypothetical protein